MQYNLKLTANKGLGRTTEIKQLIIEWLMDKNEIKKYIFKNVLKLQKKNTQPTETSETQEKLFCKGQS